METIDPSSTSQEKLYYKLRAVEFEIDAVASTVERVASTEHHADAASDDNEDEMEQGDKKDDKSGTLVSPDDFTLQQALAADRLRSLNRTKAQLEKELSDLHKDDTTKGVEHGKLLQNLVKEEPRPKRKPKEVHKLGKNKEKKQKTVSFSDDADFDTMLDAASAGFVETVS